MQIAFAREQLRSMGILKKVGACVNSRPSMDVEQRAERRSKKNGKQTSNRAPFHVSLY